MQVGYHFTILKNNLNKINFTPSKDNGYLFAYSHEFKLDETNKWLFDKVKEWLFDKNLKPIQNTFSWRHNKNKPLPHRDRDGKYAFLCYLKGKELMYNGTGFYNEEGNLDRYIGFKENRALFFNSHILHTDLQALGESCPRYSLSIFYD
jgi:hypothetical protein